MSFSSGQTSKTITVTTIDDTVQESAETMSVTLSNPSSGAAITTATGTGTINDNDAPANLAIGNASVTEGGTLSFTVTRSGNTSSAVSASYATSDGSAVAPGDYTAKSGTVSFSAGQTSKSITVTTIDDSTVEAIEAMYVTLSNPSSGATITTATGTGTINDNDNNPPVTVNDSTSGYCFYGKYVDLTGNDSDPDGNLPLTLTGLQLSSGTAIATISSASSVHVTFADYYPETTIYIYTVSDSLGATSTGTLTITTVSGPTC